MSFGLEKFIPAMFGMMQENGRIANAQSSKGVWREIGAKNQLADVGPKIQFGGVRVWIVSLLLLAAVPWCRAALEWKTMDVRQKAELGQESAVVVFPFRNAGDKPVRIVSVLPSCHCVAAKPEKEVYAPGESGEIRAEVDLVGRMGLQTKFITVATDDEVQKTVELALVIDVPEPLVITPRFLLWREGESPEEKKVEIRLADPAKVALKDFQNNNPAFGVTLENGAEAGQLLLRVKPQEIKVGEEAVIRLNAAVVGKLQVFVVYAAVK